MTKIAVWSGPRNISTAVMRSFENRPDCYVTDEPFYAYYLYKTQKNHPLKDKIIKNGELDFEKIIKKITGEIPHNQSIWYQKHMAHHNFPDENLEWIKIMKNVLLIRNPKDVIISYLNKYTIHNIDQLGYLQQLNIYNILTKHESSHPIIVDAQDIINNPKNILLKLCKKLDISFLPQMLSWPAGYRTTDGIWAKYWYSNVVKSTKFSHIIKKTKLTIPKAYHDIYIDCKSCYQQLYKHRLR